MKQLRSLPSVVLFLLGLMISERSIAGAHNFPQPSNPSGSEKIADMDELASRSLEKLKKAQAKNEPRFRLALHFGFVAIGGVPSMGEESLMGKEVNFVFRMEKLAGQLGVYRLLSDAARVKLAKLVTTEALGGHELKGFEGKYEFSSC